MDTRSKTLRRPDFNRVLVALGNKKEAIQKPSLATSKSLKTNLVGNTDSDKENTAFDVAFQQHLEKLQTEERNTFKNAYDQITPEALLDKVKLFDEAHNKGSFARKRIGPLEKFLTVLDGLVKSVSIGIQAYPDVSSLIVGAVKLVVDLALRWVTFFNKFADMLCQFSEYLPSLEKYAKSCDERILQDALANVYGDLLDFCKSGRSIFVHEDGSKKKHVSLRSLLRVQWEPFEIRFGDIKQRIVNHINQVLHAAQATILNAVIDRELIQERKDFLQWISKVNFEESHDRIFARRHPNTAQWIFQTPEFEEWFSNTSPDTLWCYGKPGTGKSVLASSVIEHITANFALSENVGMAFAYCNFEYPDTQKPSQLLASFIKQLCWKKDPIPDEWLSKFHKYDRNAQTPNLDAYLELFEMVAASFSQVFIVIDALDECKVEFREQIIDFIFRRDRESESKSDTKASETQVHSNMCLKILVISRNELDISEAFKCRAIPTIQMGTENVSKDIEIFIRGETNRLIQKNKLRIYSSELKEKVVERLTSEADGMFLWPRLQLDTICRERSEQDVEKCLKNLPRHLDETYSRMIRQINEQSDSLRTLAYKTIMWVLHAARPLRITELRHATAIGDSGRTWKDLRPYDADVIIDACANFLVEENLTIRLVHYSANEYLKASFHHSQLTDALDPSYAHTQLSFACIRYLLLDFPKEGPCQSPKELYRTIQRYTFCFYASNFFDFHLKEMLNIHDDIVKLINKFFSLGNGAIAAVLQIRRLSNAFDHAQVEWDFDRTRYSVTPATILFATRLCEVPWVAKRARWPKPGPPKAPTRATIHEAARAGEVEATKHLFKQGKSANDLDENGAEPLYYACLNGQQPVATFLVFKGANVNHQSGSFDKGSPLHIAALGGYLQIVEMLLHNGAEPNLEAGQYGTALVAACHGGHLETAKLLIKHGATPQYCGSKGFTALNEAVLSRKESLVRVLLAHGADVNVEASNGLPVLLAIKSGLENIAMPLIDTTDVNLTQQRYETLLQAAANAGLERITRALLEKGPCPSVVGGQRAACNMALRAMTKDHEGIARLLLDFGADVNPSDENDESPLNTAAKHNLADIVGLLIKRGADTKAYGMQALEWAISLGHEHTVRVLLNSGVDPNEGLAIQWAAAVGDGIIVGLLLEHGVDIRLHGSECLSIAAEFNHKAVVKVLQAKGAR